MRKSIYIAAFAVLALTACSNTEDPIFDQSAPERLEQYKKEYSDALTADGGLWSMEYFSNEDEEGYVFVMQFNNNGSVNISANHKWIGGTFQQKVSTWKMIADNGPVLSFNSYNSLFHIFADPADIPDTKDEDGRDIDETGKGHEGDYEFQVMDLSDDGSTLRLLGKKRSIDIFMHRLDVNTDIQQYLADVKNVPSKFSRQFNDMVLTDAEGAKYRVYDMYTGIPSIYPLDGDPIMQTVSANGIFTLDGFRFMEPLEVTKTDDSTFLIDKLYFTDEGAMNGENVQDLRSISPLENVIRKDMTWTIDNSSFTGKAKQMFDVANQKIAAELSAKDVLGNIDLTYGLVAGKTVPQLVTRIGTRVLRDYLEYSVPTDENGNVIPSSDLHFVIYGANNTSIKYDEQIPAYKAFKEYLCGNFSMEVNNPLLPNVITLTDKNDSSSSFTMKAK